MGLLVGKNGQYQGWLAALLCCCAAYSDDEDPPERRVSRSTPQPGTATCNTQPQRLTAPPRIPNPAALSDTPNPFDTDIETPKSDSPPEHMHNRHPSAKSLPLRSTSLSRKSSEVHRRNDSAGKRPSISAPNSFRRVELSDGQRQGLIPLKLGPVRLSPPPTSLPPVQYETTQGSPLLPPPPQPVMSFSLPLYTPYHQVMRRSTSVPVLYTFQTEREQAVRATMPATPSKAPSTPSAPRHQHQQSDPPAIASSSRRSDAARIRRSKSQQYPSQLARSGSKKNLHVNQEVLELHALVKESKRKIAARKSSDEHAPAVAPSMQVAARAETLSSIGSAFSRPARRAPPPKEIITALPMVPLKRPPMAGNTSSKTSTKISGWLSGLGSSLQQPTTPKHEPFYKCKETAGMAPVQRTSISHSDAHSAHTVSEIESTPPSVQSSPATSKAHSRSITAESHITPYSPATTYDRREHDEDGLWRPDDPSSPVGIAY